MQAIEDCIPAAGVARQPLREGRVGNVSVSQFLK
jgi:hypothetical protein